MSRLTAILCGSLAAATLVAPAHASQSVSSSRATSSGQVGAYSFPDEQGQTSATCVYKKGRLSGIVLAAPSAAGRSEWGTGGQWIDWSAQLQAKAGHGGWKVVGAPHWSDAQLRNVSNGGPLPSASVLHIFGAPNTKYRVVESISWYLANTGQQLVQGTATAVVAHYSSRRKAATSCDGVTKAHLPPFSSVSNDEQDVVNVSFAGRAHGAKIKYSIKSGSLPAGLTLHRKSGLVTGKISATASDATKTAASTTAGPPPGEAAYLHINSQTFPFSVAAKADGRTTTKNYSWVVYDTAFVMPSYFNLYGCGQRCEGNKDPGVLNITDLGPKFAFGCTTTPQPGIPNNQYSVIYKQEYQTPSGALADSTNATVVYGDVFKWWYYNDTC
jgi:hypothetical protein